MRLIYTLLLALFLSSSVTGQKLVSYEFDFTMPSVLIGFGATYDVSLYKITYNTVDARGNEHVASGLLCVPQDSTLVFPLGCYQHGTVAGREDVPSNTMGGFQLPLAFAAHGYIVAAPDFIGLGDSPGVHPYVHAATEASAAIDMMLAVRELEGVLEDVNLNDQLFIAGYSQGGHAAMALHKEIETNQSELFTVTASAPMSGPYDVSGSMVDFTLGDSDYGTVAYIAWLSLGYMEAYPDLLMDFTLESLFKPEYIEDITAFQNEEIDLWTLNDRMIATLTATVGSITPKNTLLPEIVEALKNDPDHPFSQALADNDVYNWVPQAPTRMYYCEGDDQVTFQNAIVADEYMNANGAPDVQAIRLDTDAELLNHGGCVVPAALGGIGWFDTMQNLLSATQEISSVEGIKVYYADQFLTIEVENPAIQNSTLKLYDMAGRQLSSSSIGLGIQRYDMSAMNEGFYLAQLSNNNQILNSTKVIKY